MKRVLVKSAHDAFDYVMDHYYPAGLKAEAIKKDHYVVISIQDTHTGGFGFCFTRNECCEDVLTLYFDDITEPVEGAVLFNEEMAGKIIDFIQANKKTESLLVHCYGGESRSRAVGAFAMNILGGHKDKLFKTGNPNMHVYNTLETVWINRLIGI